MKKAIAVDIKDARFNSALLKCVNLKTVSKASNVKTCVVSYLLKTSTISFDIVSVIFELNRFLLSMI